MKFNEITVITENYCEFFIFSFFYVIQEWAANVAQTSFFTPPASIYVVWISSIGT